MNYYNLKSYFQTLCDNYSQQFTEGDIYQVNYGQNSYPAMNLSLSELVQTDENSETYVVTLFYIDLLNRDRSNKVNIQSDGLEVLKSIVNSFVESNSYIVTLPVSYKIFTERFTDETAGAYVTLRIKTLQDCITEN